MQWALPKDQSRSNGDLCVETQSSGLWNTAGRYRRLAGPPPTPLSQRVADIVELYKDCSFFVGDT